MAENLFKPAWKDLDQGEIRCVLHERIGRVGQYNNRAANPYTFYLPLADDFCRVVLNFSPSKEIIAIEPGPVFDPAEWAEIVSDIEQTALVKIGRDFSFSGRRVSGWWRGEHSRVQILPPPPDAPLAPVEMADHPFILEFPVVANERWPITNYRRMRDHRELTQLLSVLLAGSATYQRRRHRHCWAAVREEEGKPSRIKWVQEFFFADFGPAISDDLSGPVGEPIVEVDPDIYYLRVGHDGRSLEVPADLDDSLCRWQELSRGNRVKFDRASFWMDMAARQWELSLSAVFASLVIAIEAMADKRMKPNVRFRHFLETHAPGAALEDRRHEMYWLRNSIIHGDLVGYFVKLVDRC